MGALIRRRAGSGDSLPQPIMPTTLERRGPSRYRADGEGNDASGGGPYPNSGITLVVVLVLLIIAAVAFYAAGRV